MNLFEIDKGINELIEQGFNAACLNPETGEIDGEKATQNLIELQADRALKLENYGMYIKNLTADINALKEQEEVFYNRKKALENKKKWLESAVKSSMMLAGEKKFESLNVVFRITVKPRVEVDESQLPEKYFREKVTREANKIELQKALQNGEHIPGAWLVQNVSLSFK